MRIRKIILAFGGIRPTAAKLGHLHHSTVQGWWDREVIPARRQREVLNLAERLNIPIDAVDLIPEVSASKEA